jgi:hypothetical protein
VDHADCSAQHPRPHLDAEQLHAWRHPPAFSFSFEVSFSYGIKGNGGDYSGSDLQHGSSTLGSKGGDYSDSDSYGSKFVGYRRRVDLVVGAPGPGHRAGVGITARPSQRGDRRIVRAVARGDCGAWHR